ncbi:MAG TPA: RIP metalloprotease RseP [Bacteroidales bacterium]|nr:RIP metalloprotease RseP [Bacteroidales bacterium]
MIQALQLLLSLSILVVFHEFGHYIAAKIFKTRVEKFYLFFNPWFSLVKKKIGETEYGIGWLPLGGYVKISGMIDESMDKEQMSKEPEPHEFRSKPAWQRLIIMLGGVTVNIILAVFIYIFMLTAWGEEYLPAEEAKYGITVDSLAYEMGLRNGDKVIKVNGNTVERFSEIPSKIILDNAKSVTVLRDGEKKTIEVPKGFLAKMIERNQPGFISLRFPYKVGSFSINSTAKKAGMQVGDEIIAMNGQELRYFDQYVERIPQFKGETISLTALRDSDTINLQVPVPEKGKIGVAPASFDNYFELKQKKYSFFEAIPAGAAKAYKGVGGYIKQLQLIFSPEVKAYKSVGGFITIGSIFPSAWNWEAFWSLTAFLSIMLAILNVLPIPALDGGHVMFLLYEIISGRPPSEKFMEYAQITGMIILFSILILANGNDILKLIYGG